MRQISQNDVVNYVKKNIGTFHAARFNSLNNLKLEKILKRKNPYLFKAKNILTAESLIRTLLDAHLSSQEETIFGNFLEGLAIFINETVYDGRKSSAEGIDLEFEKEGIKYILSIKSGPNWGNSSQIARMRDNFKKAKRILRTSNSRINIIGVNGCCYGRDTKPDKGDYLKLCGQKFWEFISGNENLYTEIIEPLGNRAKEKNLEFENYYAEVVNKFTLELGNKFCKNGKINWEELIQFNSSKK